MDKLENSSIDKNYARCQICGYPKVDEAYQCEECTNRNDNYIFSMYDYRDSFAHNILEEFKFKGIKKYAQLFSSILQKSISDYDLIVPVPSSIASLKRRGWDQMKLIASYLKSIQVADLLVNNDTVSVEQKSLGREDREKAILNRYSIMENDFDKELRVLVIDDVTTTGSTINSCINTLKNAGFKHVDGFTFFVQF